MESKAVASSFAKYVTATFSPQEDITAYELALILHLMVNKMVTEAEWDGLSQNLKRHWIRHD